ncbi:MAG: hypothetical protein WC966_11075 [Bradymonadales bacterium]|jgi:hypothetical protein
MSEQPQPPAPPQIPEVHVLIKLTPEQQSYVFEQTGRKMDSFYLDDSRGLYAKSMASRNPEDFTLSAVHAAEILNEYDEEYHEYLLALAAWQDAQGKPDPEDERAAAAQAAAELEAERLKEFFKREVEAANEARAMAKEMYKKKDKDKA